MGLIVYLAHIGSFVSCEYSKVGLVDCIVSLVNDKNDVVKELERVLNILNTVSNRSLVLIDEIA